MPTLENKLIEFPLPESHRSRFFGKLRYWWCWLAAGSMLLVIGIPSLLFLWIINRRIWFYPLALFGARVWLKACGAKVRVTGLENLDPEKSYIFASNHRSYLDTATLFAFTGKRIGLVAKKELLKVPVMGQGMSFVNIIAIDRSNPEKARESMEKARKVLDAGYSFGVFVEGTRALPGQLLPFKKGAFHLAVQTNEDIIPVAIKNTDVMMGKRSGVAYSGVIDLILLPPISVKARSGAVTPLELLLETRAAIAGELSKG